MLPPDVPQHFVPLRGSKPEGSELVYAPMLAGLVANPLLRLEERHRQYAGCNGIGAYYGWSRRRSTGTEPWRRILAVADLEQNPEEGAQFLALPASAGKAKSYADWSKDFGGWLFRTQKVELFKSPSTKDVSKPGESERDFRVRLQQTGREQRDKAR